MSKSLFRTTQHAELYFKFRPNPPDSLLQKVISYLRCQFQGTLDTAVDVGCGSGQSTRLLSQHCKTAIGVDTSEAQILQAKKASNPANVQYSVSEAEKLPFANQSVQLVTVSQAAHWFNLDQFYSEVKRVLVPNGVVALYGYSLPEFLMYGKLHEITSLFNEVYAETRPFWSDARLAVENQYADVVLPFKDVERDDSHCRQNDVMLDDITGYIGSWSGYQALCQEKGNDEGERILKEFKKKAAKLISNNNITLQARFRYFLLLGRA